MCSYPAGHFDFTRVRKGLGKWSYDDAPQVLLGTVVSLGLMVPLC